MGSEKIGLIQLSEEYFGFMACAYPVMSLSDEFYFFPRASKAMQHINSLDSLDKEKIEQDISYIKGLGLCLERLNTKRMDLETRIDYQLLKQSFSGFLLEFEQLKLWQSNPNLYLKIIIIGVEQIVSKLSMIKTDIQEELICRIKQIPRLLNEAKVNLKKFPLYYQETAVQMTEAIIYYLKKQVYSSLKKGDESGELIKLNKCAIRSLEDFKRFLQKQSSSEHIIKDREVIENLLINSFSYKRSLKDLFEIASDEYERTLTELKKVSGYIHSSRSWQKILSNYKLKVRNRKELLNLYSTQILKLKDFITKHNLISIPKLQNIHIIQTPVYLEPIRASASYSCPITRSRKESAFFYVSIDRAKDNIHQEYIFVAAHETYPGHHLLDSIRYNIKNPIRQQIESPLFYEGWASYAERLIDEFGYLDDIRQRLVGLRRQAWRAIRAKLDVGIRINKIKPSTVAEELRSLGYSSFRVKQMLRHYMLTYGYQLCYTIGKFEIERLRDKFAPKLGLKNFHNCLLAGGQLPFDLIKKRMEKLCRKDS